MRQFDPRTRLLLEGAIVGTLLRPAAPNVLVMFAQAFPVLMLMQMMSAGAMGGGISSAIARALGGGRRARPSRRPESAEAISPKPRTAP